MLVSEYFLKTTGEGLPPGETLPQDSYIFCFSLSWAVDVSYNQSSQLPLGANKTIIPAMQQSDVQDAGPGGIYGATEGVSYLVVVGIAAWSLYTKVKTGSGLPGTLLGAAEGLSFLSIVAGQHIVNPRMFTYVWHCTLVLQVIWTVLTGLLPHQLSVQCWSCNMARRLEQLIHAQCNFDCQCLRCSSMQSAACAGLIVAGLVIAEKGSLPGITG